MVYESETFYDMLTKKDLFDSFGLSDKFFSLSKEDKEELYRDTLNAYDTSCCLKHSMTIPEEGHYFGEMCTTCTIMAQIMLFYFMEKKEK
jgi:hypothetical protein